MNNIEIKRAHNWYRWLWLSPFLTIPTLIFISIVEPSTEMICQGDYSTCDRSLALAVDRLIGILGSALWHLILLIPASDKQSEFVRWHGRQGLLLAGIRTSVPLIFLIYSYLEGGGSLSFLCSTPILILIWLFGTIWVQNQVKRGECSLMRWTGHGGYFPIPMSDEHTGVEKIDTEIDLKDVDKLVEIVRYASDPEQRKEALSKLDQLGLVEPM